MGKLIRVGSLAVLGSLLMASCAFAADAPVEPAKAPAAASALDWSGFYVGADLGYSMGSTEINVGDTFIYDGTGSQGARGGVFAGYNFQFGDWVAGFEVGGALSDLRGHTELTINGDEVGTLETKTDWSASAMARLGHTISPDTLLFAGLGVKSYHGTGHAWVDGSFDETAEDGFIGVGTVSVGLETALGGNWRFRAQYDADLLRYNTYFDGALEITPRIGTAKASIIYALGDDAPVSELTDAANRWTGPYVGLVGGQTFGVSALDITSDDDALSYNGFGANGMTVGGVAGLSVRAADRLVVGIEGGIYASNTETSFTLGGGQVYGQNDLWYQASLKAGVLTSDTTLIYGFAGFGKVESKIGSRSGGTETGHTDVPDRDALHAGVGVETFVNDNISLRGEYTYTQLDALDLIQGNPGDVDASLKQNTQSATVGILYHF